MRLNRLRQLKTEGRPIVNAWLSIGSTYAAEIAAHQGFDAATVDLQHGMIGFDSALAMLQALSTTDVVPMVRPPSDEPSGIMKLLDAGAYGVICPMISTPGDAEKLVRTCRYPPVGNRSFGPARGVLYGGPDYRDHANEEVLVFAMIETIEGLANVHEIVATPGLDGIYIGPNDLALALGHKPVNESPEPEMIAAIETIRAVSSSAGLITGIFCGNGDAARQRLAEGFDLVTPGNDAMIMKAGMTQATAAARAGT